MYTLYGHVGSPYSIKMRSLLRYRQIPFRFKGQRNDWLHAFSKVKIKIIPVLEYPNGRYRNDSTPVIHDLEQRHSERSVYPAQEVDTFLAYLIEDMADEWLTKTMYAYRWAYPEHTLWTGRLIAFDQNFDLEMGLTKLEEFGARFVQHQVPRNVLVGSTAANLPVIEHIGNRVMDIMETHIVNQPFLFGSRPSIAEFGLYGQLSQFILDLSAVEPCRQRAPYTMRWLHHMDDLSGLEGEWRQESESHAPAVEALLAMIGDEYLPFLLANAEAVVAGAESFKLSVANLDYQQAPYKYQLKCLQQLREAYAALSEKARSQLNPLLEKHGCLLPLTQNLKTTERA
tara:strand:- start:967 stop:1992 length:1026 start_codon:yes stop_codon:yes gene_type:complete